MQSNMYRLTGRAVIIIKTQIKQPLQKKQNYRVEYLNANKKMLALVS